MKPFIPQELPIAGVDPAKFMPVLGAANRALARYDGIIQNSPAPTAMLLPLLVRREALNSSRIEGSQCTISDVFRFEENKDIAETEEQRDDLQEILNHAAAAHLATGELEHRRFTLQLLKTLHARLLNSGRGRGKKPGQFRERQNWIGRPGTPIEHASFVPPEPLFVTEHMEKWEHFYHSEQPDLLVQAAILHAQFELIHPFEDGNGRLGRLLISIFLREKHVLSGMNFYPSAYLEKHRDAYMSALQALGSNNADNWHHWINFFLQALAAQAEEDSDKVKKMINLYETSKMRFIDLTRSQFAIPILDAIFKRPIFRTTYVGKALADLEKPPSTTTPANLLTRLTESGVLEIVAPGKGRRPALYQFPDLIDLLQD